MARVAKILSCQISGPEYERVIGVGNSGGNCARLIKPNCPVIAVETIEYNRDRLKRVLEVGHLSLSAINPILIDDVAVTGKTLYEVRRKLKTENNPSNIALVGLMYASRKVFKQIGAEDIRTAIIYSNENGSKTPLNSLDALRANSSGVLDSLAATYFNNSEEFKNLIKKGR